MLKTPYKTCGKLSILAGFAILGFGEDPRDPGISVRKLEIRVDWPEAGRAGRVVSGNKTRGGSDHFLQDSRLKWFEKWSKQ